MGLIGLMGRLIKLTSPISPTSPMSPILTRTRISLGENNLYSEELSEQIAAPRPVPVARTIAATVATFIVPGLGHVLLGKVMRGAIIGGVIILMFTLGFAMEGHLYKRSEERRVGKECRLEW